MRRTIGLIAVIAGVAIIASIFALISVSHYSLQSAPPTSIQYPPEPLPSSKVVTTSSYSDSDLGQKINRANANCGAEGCEIRINEPGNIKTPIVLSDNRVLNFTAGQYNISASITLGNYNEIAGQGAGKTIFARDPAWFAGKGSDERTNPPGDFNQIVDADMFEAIGKTSIHLHDFTIDGSTSKIGSVMVESKDPATGKPFPRPKGDEGQIRIVGSSNLVLKNLEIREVERSAVTLKGVTNATIDRCDISSNGFNKDVLVYVGIDETRNLNITNSKIHDGSHAGLFLSALNGAYIANNTIDHNRVNTYFTGSGGQINIGPDSHDIAIINNTIINAGFTPVSEMPKRDSPIIGHGIELHGYSVNITDNLIEGNGGYGIILKDNAQARYQPAQPAHDITIQNNIFKNNSIGTASRIDLDEEEGVYAIKLIGNQISHIGDPALLNENEK